MTNGWKHSSNIEPYVNCLTLRQKVAQPTKNAKISKKMHSGMIVAFTQIFLNMLLKIVFIEDLCILVKSDMQKYSTWG
jgi:hypothetical protein